MNSSAGDVERNTANKTNLGDDNIAQLLALSTAINQDGLTQEEWQETLPLLVMGSDLLLTALLLETGKTTAARQLVTMAITPKRHWALLPLLGKQTQITPEAKQLVSDIAWIAVDNMLETAHVGEASVVDEWIYRRLMECGIGVNSLAQQKSCKQLERHVRNNQEFSTWLSRARRRYALIKKTGQHETPHVRPHI